MKTEFEIKNPSHQKYQTGKLGFEFEKNGVTLKKLNFYIDKTYFFVPMVFGAGKQVLPSWIFQKQYSLNALNDEELEKISLLTKDVLDANQMEPAFQNFLMIVDRQIGIYKQLTQTKPDAKTRKRLLLDLKKANARISKVNEFMAKTQKTKFICQNNLQ